ncbi:MAG TPA: hypothetical protein PLE19_03595 [Planctomycetota bacterium]|nr:hypothetical protein [Planctomycetota bacterium]
MACRVSFAGLRNCRKLANGTAEVVVTTDIGPRILCYRLSDGENILGLCPPTAKVTTELGDWRPVGGHRLWTAPEAIPRSYVPDSAPVRCAERGSRSLHLTQGVEVQTGILKEMTVTLDARGTGVEVVHRITNTGLWAIEVAPWALTIMNGGGCVIVPQEPFRSHDDYLLPARPMVLWHYTDLSDPRFTLGPRYLRLRTDESLAEPQKIGIANKQGWAAYFRQGTLFIKEFAYEEGRPTPTAAVTARVTRRAPSSSSKQWVRSRGSSPASRPNTWSAGTCSPTLTSARPSSRSIGRSGPS